MLNGNKCSGKSKLYRRINELLQMGLPGGSILAWGKHSLEMPGFKSSKSVQ
jgi:hypothetical protein